MLANASRKAVALGRQQSNARRADPKPWRQVEAKFLVTFQACKKLKRGCKWCVRGGPTCCADFEANQGRLRTWRDEMRNATTSRHDAEVLLIFGKSCIEVSETRSESSTKPPPTEDDEASDATQLTSLSPESEPETQAPEPSLKRKFQQAESESDAETQATSLSTQSSVCTSPSPPLHRPKGRRRPGPPPVKNRRKYRTRLRRGRYSRSIDLTNLIFPSGTPKVCRRSALHFLGLSEQRIRRICDGIPDGRTRGHRLPNSHPAFAPQLTTCMRFLSYCWHYLAEGLPDKFSIAKGDGCSGRLTLGTHSASKRLTRLELESDSEDSGEEDERSISALALHIKSAEEAGTNAITNPASGGAPCRYIGVMRPIALFHLLGEWCGEHHLQCPGWCTLLRALRIAKPFIKFRKCAGQHANCEVCVGFKTALKKILGVAVRQEILEGYCRRLVFIIARRAHTPSPFPP